MLPGSKNSWYTFIQQYRQVQNFIRQKITASFAFNEQSRVRTYSLPWNYIDRFQK